MIRDFLSYSSTTGEFRWSVGMGNNVRCGELAGTILDGYRIIRFQGKAYKAHRLAWWFVHDEWPNDQLDHRNGNKDDNRIENLREANPSENQQNVSCRGVYQHKGSSKWTVRIQKDGKRISIGSYDTEEIALSVYTKAKTEIHPFWEGR